MASSRDDGVDPMRGKEAMRLRHAAVKQARHRSSRRILFWVAALVVLSGCTGRVPNGSAITGSIVDASVEDFAIHAPSSVAAEGQVTFRIYNKGPATHEFVVVRTDLPSGKLPIGSDGTSADEDQFEVVGEVSDVAAWETEPLTLSLTPGRYVFFCNLDGHYLGGMHTAFHVTGDGTND
jgi:uncharacterized cupredoxin-like copper-binding protein